MLRPAKTKAKFNYCV